MNLESQLNKARKFACQANASIPIAQNKVIVNDNLTENQNIINLVKNFLQNNPTLGKVVIREQPPRFDSPDMDPTSLNPDWAKLANSTLGQLWLYSTLRRRYTLDTTA